MREISIIIPKRSLCFKAWIGMNIGAINYTNVIIKVRRELRVIYNSRIYFRYYIRLFYYVLE